DLTAVDWTPTLYYLSAVDAAGKPKNVQDQRGNYVIKVAFPPEIDQYPNRSSDGASSSGVSRPWTAPKSGTYDAVVPLGPTTDNPSGTAVVTIKSTAGLVARKEVSVPAGPNPLGIPLSVDLNLALTKGTNYWFDVTMRDPNVSDQAVLADFVLRPDGEAD